MTLAQLIAHCAQRLTQAQVSFGHGTLNAHDEAAWLVLWRLALPLDTEIDERPLSAQACVQVQALIDERIASRKPAAYLTREAWLQGVPFYVDERSIVPRSLIAEALAEGSIDVWLGEHTQKVLDVCTGNGSLAVLAALAWPQVQVLGTDISADALAVADINVRRHSLQERIELRQGDGLSACHAESEKFDLILCNPPYVCDASMQALPAEYRAEPALALAGGADGMDFVRRLLQQAPAYMHENAVLVLEIGNEAQHFVAAFAGLQALWLPTSAGDDQVLLLTREALCEALHAAA